ncbi:hypothetical protein [Nocardioides sambongensis]|uniref:hypothetical protein n=1 Tax=Nocardioides sambongensis TaxID=2589074 RepID=UPI001E3C182A|nr:hypothetical protein [Nocardioides sambongensis]
MAAACGGALRSKSAICTSHGHGIAAASLAGPRPPSSVTTSAAISLRQVGPAIEVRSSRAPERVSAPTSPGRATTGIIRCCPPNALRTFDPTPSAVDRSSCPGAWCLAASRAAARPSTIGTTEITAARSVLPAAAVITWPPPSESPHSTMRPGSIPGRAAARATAARRSSI